jgi:hypothetical protein
MFRLGDRFLHQKSAHAPTYHSILVSSRNRNQREYIFSSRTLHSVPRLCRAWHDQGAPLMSKTRSDLLLEIKYQPQRSRCGPQQTQINTKIYSLFCPCLNQSFGAVTEHSCTTSTSLNLQTRSGHLTPFSASRIIFSSPTTLHLSPPIHSALTTPA